MSLWLPGALVFGIVVMIGLGLTLTLLEVSKRRRELHRRVSFVTGARIGAPLSAGAHLLAMRGEAGWQAALGRRLRSVFAAGLPVRWGMSASALTLVLTSIGSAGAAWLALKQGMHLAYWISATAALVALLGAPRLLLKRQQSGQSVRFMEGFPDAIEMIVRMLRAGMPITAAVRAVGNEAPPPVNVVFTDLADQMEIGIPFEDALAASGERVGLTDFRFFAVAVALQRMTGGNLAATLDILSEIMRKRREMRLQAKATTGEVRMSAMVLGVIPFFIIGGLMLVTPDYLAPLVSDHRGKIIVGVALAMMVVGFGIIRQMLLSVTRAG
jgi:tight adherence protein B